LTFLTLLQQESFRKELAKPECLAFLHRQQFFHWQHYKSRRALETTEDGKSERSSQAEDAMMAPLDESMSIPAAL
jgi:hypothetical protein